MSSTKRVHGQRAPLGTPSSHRPIDEREGESRAQDTAQVAWSLRAQMSGNNPSPGERNTFGEAGDSLRVDASSEHQETKALIHQISSCLTLQI